MIASNRRIYYSGSMMGPIGGRALGKVFGNVIIPLQEVSSLSVVTSQNPGCLAVAMLCSLGVLGGILGFVLGFGDRDGWLAWLGISGSLALVSWVIYQATRRRHFLIASNSITVGIDYQMYGLDAIHDFLRKLGPYLPVPDVIYATEEARGGLNRLHVEAPLAQRGRNKEKEVNEQPAQIEHLVTCKAEDGPTPSRTLPVDDEFKVVTGVVRRKKARHDGPEEGGS